MSLKQDSRGENGGIEESESEEGELLVDDKGLN